MVLLPKSYTNGLETHENTLNIISNHGDANQNHNETPHTDGMVRI